jgi:hypothetical protein
MGDQINRILDITIVYPGKAHSFWALLCGNIEEIKVRVRSISVDSELQGNYINDASFRKKLQRWINDLWAEKDKCIQEMIQAKIQPSGVP